MTCAAPGGAGGIITGPPSGAGGGTVRVCVGGCSGFTVAVACGEPASEASEPAATMTAAAVTPAMRLYRSTPLPGPTKDTSFSPLKDTHPLVMYRRASLRHQGQTATAAETLEIDMPPRHQSNLIIGD
jgi:hypothetical protein